MSESERIEDKITTLIQQGETFSIGNSFYCSSEEWSVEFSSWLVQVEDLIIKSFGENSPIYRNFSVFNRTYTTESKQEKLDRRLSSALSSLSSCLKVTPEISNQTELIVSNTLSSLQKNSNIKYSYHQHF